MASGRQLFKVVPLGMYFTDTNKKKKLLLLCFLTLLITSGVFFLVDTSSVQAARGIEGCDSTLPNYQSCAAKANTKTSDNMVMTAFKWLLYGIFTVFGWVASLAVTIFSWAIDPQDVQILFNSAGVYESWKFVRDFFNLFFILVLLFIAFKVVFQVDTNFKKGLLSLVLAALFVNFSFPVSRALIDVTNVPMYFFANKMAASNAAAGTGVFGAALTASNIKGILIPGAQDGGEFKSGDVEVSRLLMAIVFIFLFSITLLVLSIMFIIRLVALVTLVIFSAVGFAASIIPGLSQYSKMWWDNFWKYAFFGPAAMLLLLVATRFFASLGGSDGPLMTSMQTVAGSNVIKIDRTFFASMALFSIPIAMLWMAMSLAQKMSIMGASSVVGLGEKVSKWAGKAPFKAGWGVTKWAGRKLDSKVLAKRNLSPRAWLGAAKGFLEHSKHEDQIPIDRAKGRAQNMINNGVARIPVVNKIVHKDTSDYEQAELEKVKAAKKKEAIDNSGGVKDQGVALKMMREGEDEHDSEKIMGAMDMLTETNGWNDYIRGRDARDDKGNVIYEKDKDGNDILDGKGNKIPVKMEMNTTNARNEIERLLGAAGLDGKKHDLLRKKIKFGIGLRGEAAGNGALAGMTIIDEKGEYQDLSEKQQAEYSSFKWSQQDAQKGMQVAHPDTLFRSHFAPQMERDPVTGEIIKDPVTGEAKMVLDEQGKVRMEVVRGDANGVTMDKWASRLTAGHAKNWSRGREAMPILQQQLRAAIANPEQYTELIKAYKKHGGLRLLIENMVEDSKGETGLDDHMIGRLVDSSGKVKKSGELFADIEIDKDGKIKKKAVDDIGPGVF